MSNKKDDIIQINRKTGEVTEIGNVEIYEFPNKVLSEAQGFAVPRKSMTAIKYLENAREYAIDPSESIHDVIKLCNVMYLREGRVGEAIDLFIDYMITDMAVDGLDDDSKEKEILEWWLSNINQDNGNMETGIQGLIAEMGLDYWIAGNVFTYKKFDKIPSTEINSKSMRGRQLNLPMEIYLLDPQFIEIPEYKTIVGDKEMFMKISTEFLVVLRNNEKIRNIVLDGFSDEDKAKILRNGEIPLDLSKTTHIKRKGRGYQSWGVPYLSKAFGAIARKKKLQALDESTIDGLINNITIFKIGEDSQKDPSRGTWSPERLRQFATLLARPNSSNYLVWTPDIEVIEVSPNENILGLDKKYSQVDKDILQSLGIPTVLLSGEGSSSDSSENVWVAISSLMEKIEAARRQIKKYVENIMYEILIENGMDTKQRPKLRWQKPNLRNEKEFRDFVLALYDRGLLPIDMTVKEAGHSWEDVKRGRLNEIKKKIDGKSYDEVFMRRDIPFSAPGEGNPGTPQGKGRPPKSSPKSTKTKTSKPTNTANEDLTSDYLRDIIDGEFKSLENAFENKDNKFSLMSANTIIKMGSIIPAQLCINYGKDYMDYKEKLNSSILKLTDDKLQFKDFKTIKDEIHTVLNQIIN